MFAVSWRSTESITTFSEIPHTLLIRRTSVSTDDNEWFSKLTSEISSHIPECIASSLSQISFPSCFPNRIYATDFCKIRWRIIAIRKTYIFADEFCDRNIRSCTHIFPRFENRNNRYIYSSDIKIFSFRSRDKRACAS